MPDEKKTKYPDGIVSAKEFYARLKDIEIENTKTTDSITHIDHTLQNLAGVLEKLGERVVQRLDEQDSRISKIQVNARTVNWAPIITSLGLFVTVMIHHTSLVVKPIEARLKNIESTTSEISSTRFTEEMGLRLESKFNTHIVDGHPHKVVQAVVDLEKRVDRLSDILQKELTD